MAKNGGKKAAPEQQADAPKRPAHEIRYARLKLTIWRQESDKGPWYSVVPTRSYRDGQQNWHSASSFGLDDLLLLAKMCDLADTWIRQQKIKDVPDTQGPQQGPREPGQDDDIPF